MPTGGRTDPDLDAVMRASRVIAGIVAESIAQAGDAVTVPQLRVLVLLATGADINASAVAAALDVHPSNATRILDRLVQAGLLDRREAAVDRRNVELSLTDDGLRLVDSVMEHRRQAFERVLNRNERHGRRRLRDRAAGIRRRRRRAGRVRAVALIAAPSWDRQTRARGCLAAGRQGGRSPGPSHPWGGERCRRRWLLITTCSATRWWDRG